MRRAALAAFLLLASLHSGAREKYCFNSGWVLSGGPEPAKEVTLPHAFNEDDAFRVEIRDLPTGVRTYSKKFTLPRSARGGKVFIEFEAARQCAEVSVNGSPVGMSERGVMAFGFDITPFVKTGTNLVEVRVDNSWTYREKATDTPFQWNHSGFNANYGGLVGNVWLHVTDKLYQTLPLFSCLGTTGTYVYASSMDIGNRRALIHAESEVRNETGKVQSVGYVVSVLDRDGSLLSEFSSAPVRIGAGETAVLGAEAPLEGIHWWSWGYGYLYTVKTALVVDGVRTDEVITRTGFRKTRFAGGKISLNDRVIQMKGYAQRSTNEWPALGPCVPAWLSDYSNSLMVEGCANLVRWMHVTPLKQDVESCDRVGLLQAMPAGDAEKDASGVQWEQRKALMRDAIIYNRNNPSVIFYECGNESISREHMLEMKTIRDRYDPFGGRAVGSREMLDIPESEYGGEMLYINKSGRSPFWAMEYCRDEAKRINQDEYSFPFHKEGEGYNADMARKGQDAAPYNRNQDRFLVEHVRRWYDYWLERPGTGSRVSSGGVKIIFSDSNTHNRSEEEYRVSGVTDALRIPKDSYFAHRVMWDGWVEPETPHIFIAGHWNYAPGTVKDVYVVSNTESVRLFLNGEEICGGKMEYRYLFTFPDVAFRSGTLEAVGCNGGAPAARFTLSTAGEGKSLKLSAITNPSRWKADGADVALVQVEVVDAQGRRCPGANDMVHFSLEGPCEWRGGIANGPDNCILSRDLRVECGVNRVILRSLAKAGKVTLKASAPGLEGAEIELSTVPCRTSGGLSSYVQGDCLEGRLTRGETPAGPSYEDVAVDVPIEGATAGANQDEAALSYDDNELSEWCNDGTLRGGWITYRFAREAVVDEVCLKLTGWRMRSYPLEIYAGDELVYKGDTPRSLGYVHLPLRRVPAREMTVRLAGSADEEDAFGGIVELVQPAAGELDLFKAPGAAKENHELRIVEIEFKEAL